jgi:hypothetical protein
MASFREYLLRLLSIYGMSSYVHVTGEVIAPIGRL